MGRNGILALCVFGLSACGGTTTTYAPNLYPALNGQNLVAQSPFTTVRSAQTAIGGTPTSPVDHSSTVSVTFVSTSQIQIKMTPPGGGPALSYTLNDVGGGVFSDNGATPVTLTYSASDMGSGAAANMLSFSITNGSAVGKLDQFIMGNRTLKVDMPKTGSANYAGKYSAVDGAGTPTTANFTMGADFNTAQVNGKIDNFSSGPLVGATFQFLNVAVVNGGFSDNLTVSGPGVSANGTNFIDGAFFGPAAKEVGGTIRINTNVQSLGGVFAGQR